jgi:dihydropyrimidinase|nr:dihydropyrimidinase [Candidatus Krumholzibacteria bacterium]
MTSLKHIQNGTLVTPQGVVAGGLLIDGETIAAVGEVQDVPQAEVIDAAGCLVIPGGVDVHTHLNLKLGDRQVSDGFFAGSVAAAWGGTTTIVDHPEAGPAGCSLLHQPAFYRRGLQAESVIDFGIHGVFQAVNPAILDEVTTLVQEGYSSAKVYLTYANKLDGPEAAQVMATMKIAGGLTAFHAECDEQINRLRAQCAERGQLAPIFHARSRPDESEAESIQKIVAMVEETGGRAYIVHLSTAKGLEVIRAAQRAGLEVLAETCPQYLILDETRYEQPDGLKYIMAPPLRDRASCEALWEGLADGSISVVATDHCSFSYADKVKYGAHDFRQTPGGCPGVETRLPLLYSEGVVKGRITLEQFVQLTSTRPAEIMGLAPRKGALEVGADADVVVWDPRSTKVLTESSLHQQCDYTPYEDMTVTGWPRMTLQRGNILVAGEKFLGTRGAGQFLHRGTHETP